MIVYFSDRHLNIIGQASTELPDGLVMIEDRKTEDVETGVAVFECKIPFDKKKRATVESCADVGNYILRSHDNESELYTIIDVEIDTKNQEVYIYAEDDGMDLLNEVVGEFEATEAHTVDYYINKYAANAGFEIGINEIKTRERKLSWDGESTATERIASIATQFDSEIAYSFEVDGLSVVKKHINIYKERGKDVGITLRLNQDIDRIVTTKSIANLATALKCTGGTPEDTNLDDDVEPTAITLKGYKYDDGDFYVDGELLKSRKALQNWSRLFCKSEDGQTAGGHIVKLFSYDTTEQATLCSHAITELKKIREMEINYEVDISKFPENVKIGDRINIVDDAGELYVSARVLQLETSVAEQEHKATLGEYLIKTSGISQKVAELAAQFAERSVTVERAIRIANNAKSTADNAQAQADAAMNDATNAQKAADAAAAAANEATASANAAQEAANNAQAAVGNVEKSVEGLETSVANAQAAAEQARQAAATAEQKAVEATQAAASAQTAANNAATAAGTAQETANQAQTSAATAQNTAQQAISDAEAAATTAAAAKLDAEQAQKDIDALGDDLTTLENTMSVDYARKTDLTESEAKLQTQITQNASGISSTAKRLQKIDETTNTAAEQAAQAQAKAQAAREEANQATADAETAQAAADESQTAANEAQAAANEAQMAADAAQSVASNAQADLAAAQTDLETILARGDATAEEIAAARDAVTAAQVAADTAQADAETAVSLATSAQSVANEAVANAETAQAAADAARENAELAQRLADEADGDAVAADVAMTAAVVAGIAQSTADAAQENAVAAQAQADAAAQQAIDAQTTATQAAAEAEQAADDLAEAEQRYADVMASVDATQEEIAAAQADVDAAQAAADTAQAKADAAQENANDAQANATAAQTAASEAATAAAEAQAAATTAAQAATQAQADVNKLAVRVRNAETKITQNAQEIGLRATKTEITETLGGYYTKEETDATLTVKADEISMGFSAVTEQLETVDGELRSEFEQIHKHIDFSAETGITIGSGGADNENSYEIQVDNISGVVIRKNGEIRSQLVDDDFYTGNIVVEVNERAQFGGFAFVPRSDGSLSFLKVGE